MLSEFEKLAKILYTSIYYTCMALLTESDWLNQFKHIESEKKTPRSSINNILALVQIMAWRRSGDRPLSESMMVSLLTHICVTRPQRIIVWAHVGDYVRIKLWNSLTYQCPSTQTSKCLLFDEISSIHITVTSQWPQWRLKSPASRLFTEPLIHAQIKENTKAPRHWPLWGEFTGDRWISRTKGQ